MLLRAQPHPFHTQAHSLSQRLLPHILLTIHVLPPCIDLLPCASPQLQDIPYPPSMFLCNKYQTEEHECASKAPDIHRLQKAQSQFHHVQASLIHSLYHKNLFSNTQTLFPTSCISP